MATLAGTMQTIAKDGVDAHKFSGDPRLTVAYNNRDHRKILVIWWPKIGYTGSVNLTNRYINHAVWSLEGQVPFV